MLSDVIARQEVVRFDIHELRAKRREVPQNYGRHLSFEQFLINASLGSHSVNRRDEETVDTAGEKTADASFLPFRKIQSVRD